MVRLVYEVLDLKKDFNMIVDAGKVYQNKQVNKVVQVSVYVKRIKRLYLPHIMSKVKSVM